MASVVGIETEHRHLIELLSLQSSGRGLLKLTTVKPGQRKAIIRIYIIKDGKKQFLTEFSLNNLTREKLEIPAIDIQGNYNGAFRLQVTLFLNGRIVETRKVNLRPFLPGRWILLRLFPPSLLCLLAALLLFVYPGFLRKDPPLWRQNSSRITAEKPSPLPASSAGETIASTVLPPPQESPPSTAVQHNETPLPAVRETETPISPAATDTAAGSFPATPAEKEAPPTPAAEAPVFKGETVYFPPDQAVLTPEAQQQLLEYLIVLKNFRKPVVLSGHCASFGTEEGRLDLSERRAEAVYRFLQQQGWNPEAEPEIRGYGSSKPVTTDGDDQYLNRRVEILPLN
ncbi:MAG: OmpA family protein [Spirochaetales bacterium]|nr:OmpA family protein [Spirochaetales bacterium]